MGSPSLQFSGYREMAFDIALRLAQSRATSADPLAPWVEDVIVPSRGVAEAITTALVQRMPMGIAGLRLHSIDTLARQIVNNAGELPRVVSEAERRVAMRTAIRTIDHPMME